MKITRVLAVAAVALLSASAARAEIQDSPIGASTACKDGKFSTSSGRGTCRGHGGVLRALTDDESSGRVPFRAAR